MKKLSKKTLVIIISVAMVLALTIGATIAYLSDVSPAKENTFTKATIDVGLTETDREYHIVPGGEDDKDPKVTYSTPDVDAYLYVKVTDETDGLVDWEIADGWTELTGYPGVYYREVEKGSSSDGISVLKGDKVTYDPALTLLDMGDTDIPAKLTFKAYIIQKVGNKTAEETWGEEFGAMPEAGITPVDVSEVGTLTDTISGDGDHTLYAATLFSSPDTEETIAESPYKDFVIDFLVSFDKDIVDTEKIHLFGQYDGWDPENWYGDDLKTFDIESLDAGETVRVMTTMMTKLGYSTQFTYADIVTLVKEFKCGVAVDDLAADYPDGLTATVQLIAVDNGGHIHLVDVYTQTMTEAAPVEP